MGHMHRQTNTSTPWLVQCKNVNLGEQSSPVSESLHESNLLTAEVIWENVVFKCILELYIYISLYTLVCVYVQTAQQTKSFEYANFLCHDSSVTAPHTTLYIATFILNFKNVQLSNLASLFVSYSLYAT